MIKINLIISKRGRDDYLRLALHNFNLANAGRKYDVVFYIGEDVKSGIGRIDYAVYKNIGVEHLYVPNLPGAGDLFCRGHIMNVLLQQMRQDYDFVCVADTDMIYRRSFFDDITAILGAGSERHHCIIAKGVYTEAGTDSAKLLRENYDYDAIIRETSYRDFATNSQITITRAYHDKIKQVLGIGSIFDSGGLGYDFIGYGVEDTLVKRIMQFSIIEVVMLKNAWAHVWHQPQVIEKAKYQHNRDIIKPLQREVVKRLKAGGYYSNRHWKALRGKLGLKQVPALQNI